MRDCFVCDRINQIKEGKNQYFVAELESGYVVIGDHQYFKGYTLFLCKEHVSELHFLDKEYKKNYLNEMSLVSEAVYNAFKPDKLNYELLGNGDSHLHFHLFPRRDGDTLIRGPVWWVPSEEMYSEKYRISGDELENLKEKLYDDLLKLEVNIISSYKEY